MENITKRLCSRPKNPSHKPQDETDFICTKSLPKIILHSRYDVLSPSSFPSLLFQARLKGIIRASLSEGYCHCHLCLPACGVHPGKIPQHSRGRIRSRGVSRSRAPAARGAALSCTPCGTQCCWDKVAAGQRKAIEIGNGITIQQDTSCCFRCLFLWPHELGCYGVLLIPPPSTPILRSSHCPQLRAVGQACCVL